MTNCNETLAPQGCSPSIQNGPFVQTDLERGFSGLLNPLVYAIFGRRVECRGCQSCHYKGGCEAAHGPILIELMSIRMSCKSCQSPDLNLNWIPMKEFWTSVLDMCVVKIPEG